MIFLYNGSGANPTLVEATEKAITRHNPPSSVIKSELENQRLYDAKMIVIPGGYAPKMKQGNLKIRTIGEIERAVNNGTRGVFICAGAYLMGRKVHYNEESMFPMLGGTALGTDLNVAPYNVEQKVCRVIGEAAPFSVFWNQGPYFTPVEDAEVILRYDDLEGKPPACIKTTENEGVAYWCGVHPELGQEPNYCPHSWEMQDRILKKMFSL